MSFPSRSCWGPRRFLHATVSRLFTPVSLGGILRNRAYSSSGLVNPLAMKRPDDQVLGWKKRGDSAELVPTQPVFDPKTTWLVIDALDAVKWAYAWAGYATDVVAARLTEPFVRFVRQRPKDLSGIKSLYAAASWELCLLVPAGQTFDDAVNDVMTRTHWLREYLDDFKLESRKDSGTRYDEDNVEPEGRPAKSKGKGKFDRTFGPRKVLTRSRSRRGASRRRSARDSMVSSTRRSRSRKHSRSLRRCVSPRRNQGAANKGEVVPAKKQPCQDYQRGKCTVQGPCPKGFIHKCSVCNRSGHGSADCWYR